jgi:Phytanoyl-CoA dioxygenase (PhyH)
MQNTKQQFDTDGYSLVKNAFTEKEIEQMRTLVYEQYEIDTKKGLSFTLPHLKTNAKYAKGDLLSKEKLFHILLNDRIINLARTVLGNNDVVYFGDSSYQIGTGLRGFHRDCIDRTDLDAPDWKSTYTLIRIGIYLQNHKDYSGGLKVKQGSHINADGKAVFVDTEVGDVVTWSLKTIHSGNAVRLKWLPTTSIDKGEGRIPSILKKDEPKERISLFMTFGLRGFHLDRYINEYELKREDTVAHLKASVYSDAALQLANSKGVEIIKLFPEQG